MVGVFLLLVFFLCVSFFFFFFFLTYMFSDLQFPRVITCKLQKLRVIWSQCFLSAGCCKQSSLPEETIGKLFSRWWLMRWLMLSKTRSFVRTFTHPLSKLEIFCELDQSRSGSTVNCSGTHTLRSCNMPLDNLGVKWLSSTLYEPVFTNNHRGQAGKTHATGALLRLATCQRFMNDSPL